MLSDACFEFLDEFEHAARKLAEAVHRYSAPVFGAAYGEEIDALRRTCAKAESDPLNIDARVDLLRLAASVMRFHDTPPFTDANASHEADMLALVRLLRGAQCLLEFNGTESAPSAVSSGQVDRRHTAWPRQLKA